MKSSCPYCGKSSSNIKSWSTVCELNICYWLGVCDCGRELWIRQNMITSGDTKPSLDDRL